MGLDQYAYAVLPHHENTAFSFNSELSKPQLIAQWRKHPNLHGWMEQLFNRKADALMFEGKLEEGGMYPVISINTIVLDADGNQIEDDKEVNDLLPEIQAKLMEEMESITNGRQLMRVFNCQPVRLTIGDLDQLEMAIKLRELPKTEGFFFGDSSDEEEYDNDLEFIRIARLAISSGYDVYYDSWW